MNRGLNLPAIQKIMNEFERESSMMDMKEEMMSDAVDDVMDEDLEDEEEEGDKILKQVLDEIGVDLDHQVWAASILAGPFLHLYSSRKHQQDSQYRSHFLLLGHPSRSARLLLLVLHNPAMTNLGATLQAAAECLTKMLYKHAWMHSDGVDIYLSHPLFSSYYTGMQLFLAGNLFLDSAPPKLCQS